MRKLHLITPLFLLLIGLSACGDPTTTSTSGEPAESDTEINALVDNSAPVMKVREIPFEEGANYLERMYATSAGKFGPENLLDGDENTWWEAMPGAGVNEGIMLYFEQPVYVETLRLVAGGSQSAITRMEVFGNGADLGETIFGKEMKIGKSVSALFFRITKMKNANAEPYYIDGGEGGVTTYPQQQLAAIAEIELVGEGGTPLKVRPLHQEAGRVTATSTLAPAEAYSPDFLFDSRSEFGWADGKDGSGTGEQLNFTFDNPVRIEKIKVWNGYQRSDKHFSSNERAREIAFGKAGDAGASYPLADEKAGQEIVLQSALEGKDFTLAINAVYPGKAYQDLVLSEMRFFDGKRWFAIFPAGDQSRKDALQKRMRGTALQAIADRSIEDGWSTNFGQLRMERSLTLRSNGSFVLYLTDTEKTGVQRKAITQVADGNWEIVDTEGGRAKIKIFGKIHRIKDKVNIYKGKSKSDNTRIFHEFLTIDKEIVRGSKLLDSIRIGLRPHDLVDCNKYAESRIDLRYIDNDNFMEEYLYSECLPCMLREDVAAALGKAEDALEKAHGNKYSFLIWDAYRPYSVQKRMWEKVSDPKYVADPYHGGSSHNKGAAVDLSLIVRKTEGQQGVPMGTDFDHFGEEAHHGYANLTPEEAANRKILKTAMEAAGFKPLSTEWWHYSLKGNFPILDVDMECDY